MRLADPWWLLVLLLVPLPWLRAWLRPRLAWPTLTGFERAPRAWAGWIRVVPPLLQALAIACLAVALARPQTVGGRVRIAARGVAIVAALDRSSSMTAVDAKDRGNTRSRLDSARRTLARFVVGRPDDLIGLVAFANYPDLACPPTLDHAFLLDALRSVEPAGAGEDGTNLGDAVAWALESLLAAPPKKKVLILLTDGRNDPAVPKPLPPREAARLARDLGVTLHTIAVGHLGGEVRSEEPLTRLPVTNEVEGPDLDLLREMADLGGGRAFVAADPRDLEAVFDTIDALERSPIRGTIHIRYRDWYAAWVAAAVGLLLLDRLATGGRLRRLP